jgi:hypothetical protein
MIDRLSNAGKGVEGMISMDAEKRKHIFGRRWAKEFAVRIALTILSPSLSLSLSLSRETPI